MATSVDDWCKVNVQVIEFRDDTPVNAFVDQRVSFR